MKRLFDLCPVIAYHRFQKLQNKPILYLTTLIKKQL